MLRLQAWALNTQPEWIFTKLKSKIMTITLVGKFYELSEEKYSSPEKGERTVYKIVITHGSHPTYGDKRACIAVKPEMVKPINEMAQRGETIVFDCDLNARDYKDANGNKKWLTDIYAFRVYPYQQMQQPMYQQPQMQYAVMPQQPMQQAVMPQPMYQQAQPMQPQFIPSSGYPQQNAFTTPAMPQGQGYGGNGNAPF